jgi:hypothetical protein
MGLAEVVKKWFNYLIDPIIRDPIKRCPLYIEIEIAFEARAWKNIQVRFYSFVRVLFI